MRISSSIIRNYFKYLTDTTSYNEQLKYGEVNTSEYTNTQKAAALQKALNRTYSDDSPYETLKKRPYLIHGKIYEAILNDTLDASNLVRFDKRTTKAERERVERECLEIGHTALPVSNKNYDLLYNTAQKMLGLELSYNYQMISGLETVGEFIHSSNTQNNVKLGHSMELNGVLCNFTGEVDLLHVTGDNIALIGEVKTNSKLYYKNHIKNQIMRNNYNFQVEFYHFLLSMIGYTVDNEVMFIMANPSRGVTASYSHEVSMQIKDILNSIQPLSI